jgi:YidC/Oxa1 family membrane protein insertase
MSILAALYNIILSPITQIIEISYRVFDKLTGNTGIAVLGVSLTVTLLCLPLYIVAESWEETERSVQAKMKNGIDRIKKVFKGDEQYMILSTYYRQNHYHPIMALRSSFGILIQIPFFLAAFHTLSNLPDLMGRTFLFIKDMGRPDAVFSIGSFNVNILPIAMTIINCISGAIYSKGHGIREKIQIYGMAALFLVVLYDSPAGLVIYWTMNNLFSLIKNIFYKMKNPLKVFYICVCIFLTATALFILFGYSGGAGLKKRLPAALFLLFWIPSPLYIRGINSFIKNQFKSLYENKKSRISIFLISALGLTLLNGLVLPSSLIASSAQEFSNIDSYGSPSVFLHSSFWMSFGLFIFWSGAIFFLFKEKVQTVLAFLFSILLPGAVINAYLFAGDYGSMDSTLKFIDGFANPSVLFLILNLICAVLCFAAVTLIYKFKLLKILTNTYLIICAAFAGLTIVNTAKINSAYSDFQKIVEANKDTSSSAVKFHLSKDKQNVVIFMLDRFESAWIDDILTDVPELKETLSGFVYYPNCISYNGHTLMGSPGLYGGYEYTPEEMNKRSDVKLKEKHNEALLLLPKLLTETSGFEAYLSDLSWGNYSYISDMSFAKNIPHISAMTLLSRYSGDFKKERLLPGNENYTLSHVINRNLFWVSLFREVPAVLRPVVYYKGTWWENGVKESSSSFADWFSCLYALPSITAVDSDSPTLSVITNEATHSGEDTSMYDLGLSDELLKKDNAYKIDLVTLKQTGEYIKFLKESGVYDNTKIIIVSDHGIGRTNAGEYKEQKFDGYTKDHLNCVLLVKDFNSFKPFSTDNTFMTNADVPSIALHGIINNPVNPFTGNKIDSSLKAKGAVVTKCDLFMPHHSKSEYTFTIDDDDWVLVKDNIFGDDTWSHYKK